MTISNDTRSRVKAIFEPIALAMGRAGLTPDDAQPVDVGEGLVERAQVTQVLRLEDDRRDRGAEAGGGRHGLQGTPAVGWARRINDD